MCRAVEGYGKFTGLQWCLSSQDRPSSAYDTPYWTTNYGAPVPNNTSSLTGKVMHQACNIDALHAALQLFPVLFASHMHNDPQTIC
jgi:hypothetical protein